MPVSTSRPRSRKPRAGKPAAAGKSRAGKPHGRKPAAAGTARARRPRTRRPAARRGSSVAQLHQGLSRQLPRAGLPLVATKGSARWSPRMLVVAIILFTLDSGQSVAERFAAAYDGLAEMFKSRRRPGRDPQGFFRALSRKSAALLPLVTGRMRRRVRVIAGRDHWRVGGGGGGGGGGRWLAFGVDGSRFNCPRTRANEDAMGRAGRAKTGPQLFLTSVFHVGTGLTWDFRRGDGKASERSHLLAMLDTLPTRSLLLADAGFTGHALLTAILASGRQFVIRAGANVRLLRGLGWCCESHDGIVHLWPDAARRRRKEPPLTLRLITLVDGRNRRVSLLTGVLDRAELSDREAGELYRQRWGAEVLYRSLKQTLGRRKMACGKPEHAAVELDWSIVSLWALALMAAEEVAAAGRPPGRVSIAKALRPVRRAIRSATPRHARKLTLARQLALAVRDDYVRTSAKAARVPVNKKRDKPPGEALARMATPEEIAAAQAYHARNVTD